MKINIKEKFNDFLNNSKDYPLLVGFIAGFYPIVFYCSNNYESVNSYQHLLFFSFLFLLVPAISTYVLYKILNYFPKLRPYKRHLLFVLVIEIMAIFLSQVYFFTIKKKLLLGLLIILCFLSLKAYKYYKKALLFVVLLSVIPFSKCIYIIIYKNCTDTTVWMKQPDAIESVKFVKKPNIYFIEPDGYAGKNVMEQSPYSYKNTMYKYLEANDFTLYKNTVSNYPATLPSNASMFCMKHHFMKKIVSNNFEMEDAREIIVGNNPVISILKNNGYKTLFIVNDEYFQQSLKKMNYDYFNIKNSEIPYFVNGIEVSKDVSADFKHALQLKEFNNQPKFYFIERMLPHHVEFKNAGKDIEKKRYLNKIEKANLFLKETINLINKKDPSAIIIIASDHGGWVGIESLKEMLQMKDKKMLNSIFGNLIAIKWNDNKHFQYDAKLKSNVNLFRILFSYLSEDKKLLLNVEKDMSYNNGYGSFL